MELSKEVYSNSPEKNDVQSVVKDIMQDESIVGKKNLVIQSSTETPSDNPPEKKKRGRPPKNANKKEEDTNKNKNEVVVKKPRGRPRKIKQPISDPPPQSTQEPVPQSTQEPILQSIQESILQSTQESIPQSTQEPIPQSTQEPTSDPQLDIIPLIQSISSSYSLHKLPPKTLKYVIFLIQLFQNNPPLHTTLPKHTLHTLILHTIQHHHHHPPHPLQLQLLHHTIFSASTTNIDTELNTNNI